MQINSPKIWKHLLKAPDSDAHKYDRGHALIHGAFELTGATHLAASACSRIGAGLTTVVAPETADLYRTILPPDIMVRNKAGDELKRVSAILAGPGGAHKDQIAEALHNPYGASCILDANAIPAVNEGLYPFALAQNILTPHEGEFARAFPMLSGERAEKAVSAAKITGCIIVLKGKETIIAHPDGRSIANQHASPWLAKAGTGDVLAGMITGLAAQGLPLFEVCAAACWLHGEAGKRIGAGLVASDMEKILGAILQDQIA